MVHTFEYCVLQATPDRRRGERVNVGLLVFRKDGVDVRLTGLPKIRALSGKSWNVDVELLQREIEQNFRSNEGSDEFVCRYHSMEHALKLSSVGRFIASEAEYDARIDQIQRALIMPPRSVRSRKSTRINTEISNVFRKAKVLAKKDESIEDHKVVRDFYVSKEEELKADFALKNGVYHVATTLDLRQASVNISKAALKAVVLDKARAELDGARCIGVYALEGDDPQYRPHLELLSSYATETYNWLDDRDRQTFTRSVYSALEAAPR